MGFNDEIKENIEQLSQDNELHRLTQSWLCRSALSNYSYNFSFQGRPIIQYPQDIVAMQELIWQIKPDLIVETGIAHGGSLVLSASMLAILDYCDAVNDNVGTLDVKNSKRKVIGLDIDIRAHNKEAIESHPLAHKIEMLEGSSINSDIIEQVHKIASDYDSVLVCLDSNHTHEHVLAELEAYAPLVTAGSYCCVFDTIIEDMPDDMFPERSWGPGDNPKTAVWEYLKTHPEFAIDKSIQDKLLITVAPDGYLKRIG